MADPATNPAMLAPVRNPGLLNRIAGLWARSQPYMGPQVSEKNTTETGVQSISEAIHEAWTQYFQGDQARRAIYKDADKMDNASEEGSRVLHTIANNAVMSEDGTQQSFVVESQNEEVQQVIDELVARTRLHRHIKSWFRNTVKYGDAFIEPVINQKLEIVKVKQLPPETMFRNEDKYGELNMAAPKIGKDGLVANKPGETAFDQRDDTGKVITAFWPWQIVHLRHDHDDLSAYGQSMFWVARQTWKKLRALEEALVIGRMTRDLLKLVFYLDTTGLNKVDKARAIQDFKQSITQRNRIDGRKENPFSVMTDFFITTGYITDAQGRKVPALNKVDVIDPKNEGIHQINDIEYLHTKFTSELVVPRSHMGFDKDSAGAGVVTAQDVQYVRWLKGVQQEVTYGLEQLFDLQLILAGINPLDVANAYAISWPELKATNEAAAANTALAYAQRDQIHMQEGVVSKEWVRKHEYGMTDDESADVDEQIAIAEQQELDNLAAQTAIGAMVQSQPTGTGPTAGGTPPAGSAPQQTKSIPNQVNVPSVHRDTDGQRKGDEGRTRDGQRIAPTRSKKGTPPGSGSRTKKGKKALAAENVALLRFLATAA